MCRNSSNIRQHRHVTTKHQHSLCGCLEDGQMVAASTRHHGAVDNDLEENLGIVAVIGTAGEKWVARMGRCMSDTLDGVNSGNTAAC
jgi:hypothetical protein